MLKSAHCEIIKSRLNKKNNHCKTAANCSHTSYLTHTEGRQREPVLVSAQEDVCSRVDISLNDLCVRVWWLHTPSRWWLISDINFTGATLSWQFCHCIWGLLQPSPPSSSSPSASYPFLRALYPKPCSSPLLASYLLSSVPSPHTSWFLSASSWGPTGRSDCTPPEPDGTDETSCAGGNRRGLKGPFAKIVITSTTSQYICVALCYGLMKPNIDKHIGAEK